ncbi:MAG: thioredoxin family protein [Phycisphaeraceae bacterium]|nr:thioredoxin family protein [Phycisphaeraceae bacterium]
MTMSNLTPLHHPVRTLRLVALAFASLLLLGVPAPAAQPAPSDDAPVAISAIAQRTTTQPGDRFAVAVVLEFAEGWHVWPHVPVVPKELDGVTATPTDLGIPSEGTSKGITAFPSLAQWPKPAAVETGAFTGDPIRLLSYAQSAVIFLPVRVDDNATPGPAHVSVEVSFQACNETTCQPPTSLTATAAFEIVAAGTLSTDSPSGDAFKGFDQSVLAEITGVPSTSVQLEASSPPRQLPSLFGVQLPSPDSAVGVFVLLLVSILGGASLNLTPCVLPVIPIKVMTLVQHANSPGRTFALGVWMFLGVVAFWVAVGLPMAVFSAVLDPSRLIFGTWWVTLSLGLIITAMGLGIMGLFTFNLPQSVYLINPKADTPGGSFFFGVMTAVLGLPCFGFVAGGLLVGAPSLGGFRIMVIFTGLGLGMAVPYLVLSAKPGLVHKIPRTGPASDLVKQVMGLLLLAAAAFFVAAGIQTLLHERPYLSKSFGWWVVAFFVTLAGGWLALRTVQISRAALPRVVLPFVSLLAVGVTIAFAAGMSRTAREDWERSEMTTSGPGALITGAWHEYSAARFEQAILAERVVVVDFTADWCINCKVLKQTILDTEPVRSRLQQDDVVLLEVDLTSSSAPGWTFLQSLGQTGVPTLAIFGPGASKPIVYNVYTPSVVIAAIERAKGPPATAAAAPTIPTRP